MKKICIRMNKKEIESSFMYFSMKVTFGINNHGLRNQNIVILLLNKFLQKLYYLFFSNWPLCDTRDGVVRLYL